jgi:NDP-sugar pyrophosphorylase family protein
MINWIFPIAGKGTRTKEHGKYKPFIDIQGKMMIERCLDNLRSKFSLDDEFYFVTTEEFKKEFDVTRILRLILFEYKVKVIVVPETPPGQAFSVKYAVDKIENNNTCIIVNCDQLTLFDLPASINKCDVLMPLYFTNHGKSCYVEINNTGLITLIVEKELVSNYASSGTFIFGSKNLLENCIDWGIDGLKPFVKELYLGPCINYVNVSHIGMVIPITTYMKIDLGTDEQIEKYLTYLKTLRINSFSNYETVGHYE